MIDLCIMYDHSWSHQSIVVGLGNRKSYTTKAKYQFKHNAIVSLKFIGCYDRRLGAIISSKNNYYWIPEEIN